MIIMPDEEARQLLENTIKRTKRFIIFVPIIFVFTVLTLVIGGNLLNYTGEEAYRIVKYAITILVCIILFLYIINWIHCFNFVKKLKRLDVNDHTLKGILWLNKICCILYMIPITFLFGLAGFNKVRIFYNGRYRQGTLDEILYNFLIKKYQD